METLNVSRWTEYQWERFREENDVSRELRKCNKLIPGGEDFAREVFARLYSGADGEDFVQVKEECAWAIRAHQELSNSDSFSRLQARARRDRYGSGVAAVRLATQALTAFTKDNPAPTGELGKLREKVRDLIDWAKTLEEAGATEEIEKTKKRIEDLKKKGKQRAEDWRRFNEKLGDSDVLDGICVGISEAAGKLDEACELEHFAGWGAGSGSPQAVGGAEKAQLASQVECNPKLAEIAKEAGRLKQIASSVQRQKPAEGCEVSSVKCGDDLGRLLPSELVKLTDPALILDFGKKFTERSLLEYDLKSKQPEGRGPIVVCIDNSYSMSGSREVWSKAMALALLTIARKQKRDCRVIHFDSSVSRTDDFKFTEDVEVQHLLNSMVHFSGGGTNFENPLRAAHETIDTDLKKADIVFITDGECDVSDDFREWWDAERKALDYNVFGIHVGAPGGVAARTLDELSDKSVGVADVANDANAHEAFSI